jgi:hypothetical protein
LKLPQGIWKSVEPNIVLYIEDEYQSPVVGGYLGIYTTEYEEIKIFTLLNIGSAPLSLERARSLDLERGGIPTAGAIFRGRFEVIDNEMHYTLDNRTREQTGYKVIIFHRVEDYEPINPDDWFR